MGLILPQMVEIGISCGASKYYENLGYIIPRELDDQKRLRILRNTKIEVNVLDLPECSNIKIKAQCDICGRIIEIGYSHFNRNIDFNNGLYQCNDSKKHTQLQCLEKYKLLEFSLKGFLDMHGRFPKYNEYTKNYGFDYSYTTAESICKLNNTSLKDLYCDIDCFKVLKPSQKYYDKYLSRLLNIINESNLGTSLYRLSKEDNCKKFNLPNIRWFIENCPNKNVNDISSFKKWAGIFENYLTKEQCTEIIVNMSREFTRPLMYNDFRGTGYGHVSINMIKDYWGSLNKMKTDIGLEIIQENMIDKQLSKNETIEQVRLICNYIKEDGRNFTSTREIDNLSVTVTSGTLRKMVKKYFKMSLPEYLKLFDIEMGKEGNGIVFNFEDGEKTISQFEYIFSKYLRDFGLKYNKDYFRDIRYKDFISNYNGMMNCDYIIKINDKTLYIEIAGIIEAYKLWYYQDKAITISRSKDKYRLKLKEKEQMLKDNNLIYFILFPCDLTRENFIQIISDSSLELRHNIEKFMKNNINWINIQTIGELKYKEEKLSRCGQLIVDYEY